MKVEQLQTENSAAGGLSHLTAGLGATTKKGKKMMSEFSMHSHDIDTELMIELRCAPLGGFPNQADLRQAVDALMCALRNWDEVEITIRKFSLGCETEFDGDDIPIDKVSFTDTSNAPHEGRTAASSPGVPLDAVVSPHGRKG